MSRRTIASTIAAASACVALAACGSSAPRGFVPRGTSSTATTPGWTQTQDPTAPGPGQGQAGDPPQTGTGKYYNMPTLATSFTAVLNANGSYGDIVSSACVYSTTVPDTAYCEGVSETGNVDSQVAINPAGTNWVTTGNGDPSPEPSPDASACSDDPSSPLPYCYGNAGAYDEGN